MSPETKDVTKHEKKHVGKSDSGKKGTIKIKQVVSFIGSTDDIRQAVRGLGLRRLHHTVEREDTPSIRGMIHKVRHLVVVVE